MSFENFDYDIITVCNMAGIAVDPNKDSQYIDCPLCGGKKKMHIDLMGNGFICHHCGEKGGVLKLYMLLFNCPDTKTAHRELMKAVNGDENAKKEVEYRKANPPKPEVTVADIGSRDKAYNALLSNLSLTTVHKISLLIYLQKFRMQ